MKCKKLFLLIILLLCCLTGCNAKEKSNATETSTATYPELHLTNADNSDLKLDIHQKSLWRWTIRRSGDFPV